MPAGIAGRIRGTFEEIVGELGDIVLLAIGMAVFLFILPLLVKMAGALGGLAGGLGENAGGLTTTAGGGGETGEGGTIKVVTDYVYQQGTTQQQPGTWIIGPKGQIIRRGGEPTAPTIPSQASLASQVKSLIYKGVPSVQMPYVTYTQPYQIQTAVLPTYAAQAFAAAQLGMPIYPTPQGYSWYSGSRPPTGQPPPVITYRKELALM